jgi:glutamine synthetase adenylyltransferase
MSKSIASHYKSVFGEDGKRSESQQAVWNDVVQRILRDSKTEEQIKETGRDFALYIFQHVNKETNGITGPKYKRN